MARELLIIDGKCYEITNLGWNPKQLNPQVKEMCKDKDLRARSYYVKKNSNDRKGYTLEQLAKKYDLGTLDDKLWEIIENEYESFQVEADWNKEFPESENIKWED